MALRIRYVRSAARLSCCWPSPPMRRRFGTAQRSASPSQITQTPSLAQTQARLTANVWITRGSSQGLFNEKTESSFTHYVSPAGTEWANGSLENYATLSYTNWNHWAKGVNPNPYATVGVQAVL